MPYVAAGVTTAIPAVEGLQPDGGLGALTPRTKETRIGPPGIVVVVRLRHSWVPSWCSHIRLRRSARVVLRRSAPPVRRLNACCSCGLGGQSRSHVRQCQQRATSPRQMPSATTTVPAERQKTQRVGTKDHITICFAMTHSGAAAPMDLSLWRRTRRSRGHTCRRERSASQ